MGRLSDLSLLYSSRLFSVHFLLSWAAEALFLALCDCDDIKRAVAMDFSAHTWFLVTLLAWDKLCPTLARVPQLERLRRELRQLRPVRRVIGWCALVFALVHMTGFFLLGFWSALTAHCQDPMQRLFLVVVVVCWVNQFLILAPAMSHTVREGEEDKEPMDAEDCGYVVVV